MPQPNPNATSSTFQVGTYTSLTDTFSSVFDLNDGVNSSIMWNTLKLPQPEKAFVRSFNLRAPGERVTRFQYKNRHIQVSVALRGSTVQAILNTCHNLIAAIENPPYRIRFSQPNATNYTYASVVAVTHNIPADPQTLLAKALPNVQIDFECLPGLLGDRVTLSNLVTNPGFEAPSGPGVQVFNDSFASINAYTSTFGSAPTTPANNTFVDVVEANGGANLIRYYRLGEASGTTAYDIAGLNLTGTYTGSPALGVAGGVSGDTDTAITLNGTTQYVDCSTASLFTGNAAFTMLCRFKIAANPASTAWLMTYGAAGSGAHNVVGLNIDSTGKVHATTNAGTESISAAVTLNVYHTAAILWDGTTLTGFVDGVSSGGVTPGANTIPASSLKFRLGATADTTPAGFFAGQIDECMVWSTNITVGQYANINTAAASGATGTTANTMVIPSASRVAFGSPSWSAYNAWQLRFRWVTGLTAQFYLHFTDGNNYLRCQLAQGSLVLQQAIGGTVNTLQTVTPTLTHEAWYWVSITQFPNISGNAPYVQATLYYDDAGLVGSQVTTGVVGPVATADGVTALIGKPQIMASGAALVVGGNVTNAHALSLFGPGGWFFAGVNSSSGLASLGWDGIRSELGMSGTATPGTQTYGGGPVTSQGAARIDIAPAGTTDARLTTWDGFISPVAQYGIPTAQNHVLGYSVAIKTSGGLSGTSLVQIVIRELNSSGTELVANPINLLSGTSPASWSAYSGTYTVTNAATAYVKVQLRVVDTAAGGSANATVWFDNVQLYDQTATGQTSMPYCELRFPQSPAQLVVSGLVGDLPTPALLEFAPFLASWPPNSKLTFMLGRRAQVTAGAQLAGAFIDVSVGPVLDSTSYGGYYWSYSSFSNKSPVAWFNQTGLDVGTYHIFTRAYSAQTAPNVTKLGVSITAYTIVVNATLASDQYVSAALTPFTAQNVWTLADAGQLSVPLFARGASVDLMQTFVEVTVGFNDPNTPAAGRANWWLLLPVDSSLLYGTLLNAQNGGPTVTNQWLWSYADGQGVAVSPGASGAFAWSYSLETAALPAAAHGAGGAGNIVNGIISINPAADPYLTLDPTLTVSGVTVNQFGGVITDGNGAVLSFAAEILYTPQYLYPR